jgi:hypothetical protein
MHWANGPSSASPRRVFVSAIQTGPYERMDGLRRRIGVASSLLLKSRKLD